MSLPPDLDAENSLAGVSTGTTADKFIFTNQRGFTVHRSSVSPKRSLRRWSGFAVLALGAFLAPSVLLVPSAAADVDTSDCDDAALGDECFQYELLRTERGVLLTEEDKKLTVPPALSPQQPTTSPSLSTASSYKITNSVSETNAYAWAFGASVGGGGKLATPITGTSEANITGQGTANYTTSGNTTVTRSSETSIAWTTTYDVSGPALPVRKGYEIWVSVEGNRYEVNERRCERKIWGLWCGEWATITVTEPTGLYIRPQPLGWTQTIFRSCPAANQQVLYKSHYRPEMVGEPGAIGCITFNFENNTFSLTSSGGVVIARGRFITSEIDDDEFGDPEKLVVEMQGDSGETGTVTIERDEYPGGGNTFRPGRMNSAEVKIVAAVRGTEKLYATFEMIDWPLR